MGKVNLAILEKLVEKGLIKPETLELAAKGMMPEVKQSAKLPTQPSNILGVQGGGLEDIKDALETGRRQERYSERAKDKLSSGSLRTFGFEDWLRAKGIEFNEFDKVPKHLENEKQAYMQFMQEAAKEGFVPKNSWAADYAFKQIGEDPKILQKAANAGWRNQRKGLDGLAEMATEISDKAARGEKLTPQEQQMFEIASKEYQRKANDLDVRNRKWIKPLEQGAEVIKPQDWYSQLNIDSAVRNARNIKKYEYETDLLRMEQEAAEKSGNHGKADAIEQEINARETPNLKVVKGIAAPMAGAMASGQGFQNPTEFLGPMAESYDRAKQAVWEPIVKATNWSKDPSFVPEATNAMKMIGDPINLLEGGAGVMATGLQGVADYMNKSAPEKGYAKGGLISPQHAEQLFKKGLLKPETYAKFQKMADGGITGLTPSIEELAQGAGQMAEAMPTAEQAQYEKLKSDADLYMPGVNPVDREKYVLDQVAADKEKRMMQQAPPEQNPMELEKQAQIAQMKEGLGIGGGQPMPAVAVPPQPGTVQLEPTAQAVSATPTGEMAKTYLGTQGDINSALDAAGTAALKGAQAGAAGAAAQGQYLKDMSLQMAEMEKTRQAQEALRQSKMDEAQAKLNQSLEDFQKAAVINPNKYWADKSTGNKIGLAIALAFSGANGSHVGMQIVENAINRDIDAQKAAINTKSQGFQMQQNIYKTMLDQFGDQRQAELAAKQALMGIAEIKLKQIMATTDSQKALQAGNQALAELGIKKAQLNQEMMKTMLTSPAFIAQDDRLRRVSMIGDNQMKETGMKELGEYEKHQQVIKGIKDSYDTMKKYRRSLIPGTEGYQQYNAALAKMQTLTSEVFGGKSEPEFEIIKKMMPTMGDNSKVADKKLDDMLQKADSQVSFPVLWGMGIVKKPLPLVRK